MTTTTLPPTFCPFHTTETASCAYWITCSPHEWVWTQAEQEAMAKAIVNMDKERNSLRMALGGLLSALKKDNEDEASKALIAACVNAESMLTKEYINFFKLHD